MKKIYEYENGEEIALPVLIKEASVRKTNTDKDYIAFTFQDKSGQIDAKLWGATRDQIESFTVGRVVFLKGLREMYRNTPQIKIYDLAILEDAQVSDFVESAPMSAHVIEEAIDFGILQIANADISRVVKYIYKKYKKEFYEYPAAKRHHHAIVGGLSYHTVSMLKMAQNIAEQYPELNKSLLYAGVLLHDIGKVIELSGSIGTTYTLEGNMLGHIVILSDEITKACLALDISDQNQSIILLKHMILAHHGKLEYGSPVPPKLIEAEVLHYIDMIDAKINMSLTALDKTKKGEFSEKIYGLDNRALFKPDFE